MILYVQSVYIMSDKINYANCMKRKCEQCRYYDYCFRYRGDISGKYNDRRTNGKHKKSNNRSS